MQIPNAVISVIILWIAVIPFFNVFLSFNFFFHFSVPDVYLEPEMCQGQAV